MLYFFMSPAWSAGVRPHHYKSHPCSLQPAHFTQLTHHGMVLMLMYIKDLAALPDVHLIINHKFERTSPCVKIRPGSF